MIDGVLVHAGAIGNYLPHLATNTAYECRSAWLCPVTWIVRENTSQFSIVNRRQIKIVTFAFAPVVFAQRDSYFRKWLYLSARAVSRFSSRQLAHQIVDIFKFL